MSDENTIDDEKIVVIHELTIAIAQMEDGSLHWQLVPDKLLSLFRNMGLHQLADCGAPRAALAIRALWKMCDDGMVFHALELATDVHNAVSRLQSEESLDPRLMAPMESMAIN